MNKELRNLLPEGHSKHRGETGATTGSPNNEPDSIDLDEMGKKYSRFISFL